MVLRGLEHLAPVLNRQAASAKMVFNARGALILPASRQHRDEKAEGISYEDDYKGNALAAMITPGLIEIRYHAAFTDVQVAQILHTLLAHPDLAPLASLRATYQGRPLNRPVRTQTPPLPGLIND